MTGRGWWLLEGAWGFAEATLFFVVPDVALCAHATKSGRRALVGCAWATLGAVLGGTLMWFWGAHDLAGASGAAGALPSISDGMIERVGDAVGRDGLASLFVGPLTGTPYKLYALHAGDQGVSLLPFVLVSVPARALRFLAVTGLTAWASRWPVFRERRDRLLWTVVLVWVVFYAVYWAVVPW